MTPYLIAVVALLAVGGAVGWLRWRLRIVTVFGDSMRPTLESGDRLLVRRTSLSRIRIGDIVVIQHPWQEDVILDPGASSPWLIKRAVATPGDPVPASVAPRVPGANEPLVTSRRTTSSPDEPCTFTPPMLVTAESSHVASPNT